MRSDDYDLEEHHRSPRPSLDDSTSERDDLLHADPRPLSTRDEHASLLDNLFDKEKRRFRRASPRALWPRFPPWPPTRTCCLALTLTTLGLLLVLGGGGFYAVTVGGVPPDGESEAWYPSPRGGQVAEWADAFRKAGRLVARMTLVEKVNVTSGVGWMMGPCLGNTAPVPRLGFPGLCLQDGPLGLRMTEQTTAFPAGLTVGATWSKELMYERGAAHGREARGKGIHVILGPAMGPLGRLPAGGRNWEGFGSDPVLQGVAAYQTIKGIQDQGVQATAKHYVGNEQEHYRQAWAWGTPNAISSNIDDRTLHEIYAWPFADSVRAGVASVMCSYNQVNNSYACQNSKLLNGVLKDELGFQGYVQSDWLAQRSGVASALAGLDVTMPGDGLGWADGQSLWGAELTKAVLNGTIPVERLNDMALRVVAAWYYVGQDDEETWPKDGEPNFSSWTKDEVGKIYAGSDDPTTGVVNKFINVADDHHLIAYKVAQEGIVMVKNEGLLPLLKNGFDMTQTPGRKLRLGIFGEDAFDHPKGPNSCEDRACNEYHMASGWGSGAVDFPYLASPATGIHASFEDDSVEYFHSMTNEVTSEAEKGALHSDICMVFISSDGGEGYISWQDVKGDRNNLYSQKGGDDLVKRIAAKCGNNGNGPVIVVLHNVGPVIVEEWIDLPNVKAVLIAHLGGQESGYALASVLFGDHNPSGHLPYTIAKREEDYGPTSGILTHTTSLVPQQNFSERMYIDYRHFDAHNIEPRFEFGYGLSFTQWQLSDLELLSLITERTPLPSPRPTPETPPTLDRHLPPPTDAIFPKGFHKINKYVYPYLSSPADALPSAAGYPYPDGYSRLRTPSPAGGGPGGNPDLYAPVALARFVVAHAAGPPGHVVPQVYVTFPADVVDSLGNAVDFPPVQLRAFEKAWVGDREPGDRLVLEVELTRRDLSFWDVGLQNWVMPRTGGLGVAVGLSSRDLRLRGEIPFPE